MNKPPEVLVVGAGPTGLALTAQLLAFGATVRIIDRRGSPVRPSRALVVQPRTLEVLRSIGLAEALRARGDARARARLHLGACEVTVGMHDDGLSDTPYPFLLLLHQAETEAALRAHLQERGVAVEWGTEFVSCDVGRVGVTAVLRHADGSQESAEAAFLAGCDGADSTVRQAAGIGFAGRAYRQSVLLADVAIAADLGQEPLHAFVSPRGGLVLFAGGEHAPWRIILIRGGRARHAGPLDADGVTTLVADLTQGRVAVRQVAWITDIPQQRRLAGTFRAGRIVLAGDAAHVHTPAGARGMNTGIQDACNLGWKLALVTRDIADDWLLGTYDDERRRAARASSLLTHLIFLGEAADLPLLSWTRAVLAPLVVPAAAGLATPRRLALRTIGQLGVRYRRGPLAVEGRPRLRGGPRAGARMPDAPIWRNGQPSRLHSALATPGVHLLLCGPSRAWSPSHVTSLQRRTGDLLTVHFIAADPLADGLHDPGGVLLRRLGARPSAQYLIRPDGYIGYRCAGASLDAIDAQLNSWLPRSLAEASRD